MLKKSFGNRKFSWGFTLVEIIVVLVILAILAAATIPSLLGFIKNSKYASLDNEASAVRTAAQAYATEHFAKGDSDSDIKSAIYGTIKPGHALYSLLQNDVNGMIYEPKVENGKIKGFKYTKAVIDGDEGEDFISDKDVQLTQFDADKSTFIHASERIASINLDDFKAQMKEDLIEELASTLTSDQPSSLKSTLATDLNSTLESGMTSRITALKTNFATELGSLVYPVGSYYITNDDSENKRPNVLFGGTWVRVEDEFLYCMSATNAKKPDNTSVALSVGGTGGSKDHKHTTGSHTLTVTEIPSHNHSFTGTTATGQFFERHCLSNKGHIHSASGVFSITPNSSEISQDEYGIDVSSHVGNEVKVSFSMTPSGSISNTGSGSSHNHGDTGSTSNIPPYVAVYCWRRTA